MDGNAHARAHTWHESLHHVRPSILRRNDSRSVHQHSYLPFPCLCACYRSLSRFDVSFSLCMPQALYHTIPLLWTLSCLPRRIGNWRSWSTEALMQLTKQVNHFCIPSLHHFPSQAILPTGCLFHELPLDRRICTCTLPWSFIHTCLVVHARMPGRSLVSCFSSRSACPIDTPGKVRVQHDRERNSGSGSDSVGGHLFPICRPFHSLKS